MPAPIRICVVIGTRPEAIKLAPVILAARARRSEFDVSVVRTGQHRELVDQLMEEFGLQADVDLDVMRRDQDLAHVMSASIGGLSDFFARERPDWVLVQGDTTTTFAGALAAFYNHVRIGHVEAGLRTGNRSSPFPEEANRSLTARIADLHFAPTPQARANLLAEGIADEHILVTGNTVVDALLRALDRPLRVPAPYRPPGALPYVLVTAHRRENHGPGLKRVCEAVLMILDEHPKLVAVVPMHPSPRLRDVFTSMLGTHARVHLTDALGYRSFVTALQGAALVLTDSGGVQEECCALGKPVLVLREDTERPEAVDAGVAVVVGTCPHDIACAAARLLDDSGTRRTMSGASKAFGEGTASTMILDALLQAREQGNSTSRPTESTASADATTTSCRPAVRG